MCECEKIQIKIFFRFAAARVILAHVGFAYWRRNCAVASVICFSKRVTNSAPFVATQRKVAAGVATG